MVRILLVCTTGMSSSVLVSNTKKAAEEEGVDAFVTSYGSMGSIAIDKDFDVVMVAPQVRFQIERFKAEANNAIPVVPIDMTTYGTVNGKKLLAQALAAIEDWKNK